MGHVTGAALFVMTSLCVLAVLSLSLGAETEQDSGLELEDVHGNPFRRLATMHRSKDCQFQADPCNPYTKRCCAGMKCSNYNGGYCLPTMERCVCLPDNTRGDVF